MDTDDSPEAPPPTPTPTYTLPNPSEECNEEDRASGARNPALGHEDTVLINEKIAELEAKVEETTKEIREKIEKLESDMFDNTLETVDIRSRTADLEEAKRSKKKGKRGYRKGRGRVNHRYPTRYSESFEDDRVQLSSREYGDVERKARNLEDRVDRQQKEVSRLREELAKVEALTPKISELSAAFENFRTHQVRISFGAGQDLNRLRNHVHGEVSTQLGTHAKEIASLNTRYQALFSVAAAILAQQNAAGKFLPGQKPFTPSFPTPGYPSPFLTPGTAFSTYQQSSNVFANGSYPTPVRKAIAL
jgi:hypothetical protein